jgi:hypothetical protein
LWILEGYDGDGVVVEELEGDNSVAVAAPAPAGI